MWPVPAQYVITTAYGKRGSYWSCNEDGNGNGVHTGCDMACPEGTPLYAAIDGQIRHRSYGSAFGSHQFAISPDPGQPWANGEVFYAHARKRLADGVFVKAGEWVGEAGAEGNVSGPHLHFELHADSKNVWNCGVHDNPQPALDWQPTGSTSGGGGSSGMAGQVWTDYSGKPSGELVIAADAGYVKLDADTADPPFSGLEFHMLYAHIDLEWNSGSNLGEIRVKYVREGGDATAYQDYTVPRGKDDFLITAQHWEAGEKGIGGQWYINVGGGIARGRVGTRYQKAASVEY